MAVGRPVITTDATGCRDMVENGINGFIVPKGNVATLAEKMQLLMDDFDLKEKMGLASRRLAEEHYDEDKINAKIVSIITHCINEKAV